MGVDGKGIAHSQDQKIFLGNAPGLTTWFFGPTLSYMRAGLRRDVQSVLGFVLFLAVYLAVATIITSRSMSLSNSIGNEEQRGLHFAAVFQIIILATLVASLGHVAVLGWMRRKYSQLPLGRFLLQQAITALLSAAAFLRFDQSFFGAAVLAAPAGITLLVYTIGERVATNSID